MYSVIFIFALFTNVIHCDKKPLYHESSKQVFQARTALDTEALFGYGISYLVKRQKVIISAPRANKHGEVFECNITENVCSKINIPLTENSEVDAHFWLGAAVCTGADFFLTCAPSYSKKQYLNGKPYSKVASQCFYQNATTGEIDIKQLDEEEKIDSNKVFNKTMATYMKNRFDTQGWSMDVDSDGVAIVGGPGAVMGRAMIIPKNKTTTPQLIHLKRNDSDPEGLVLYYFGYGVKAGNFLGSEVYAISSPYGAIGRGKVLFYSKALEYMQAIVDDEVAAIFGGALCGARLGAGAEALLVGAPASVPGPHQIDVGAVHIYLYEAGEMHRKRTIRGYNNNGYFGHAIANVGDVNLDGIDEVVISAPYENEYRGAVYIFSGADLVKDATAHVQWLQRVEGEAPEQMMGLALSAVQDLDGNGCNELTIGLPGNNSAVLMKCISFITFTIDLYEENPIDYENNNSTSVYIHKKMCITYKGKLKRIDDNVEAIINLKHPNATLYNSENNTLLHNFSLLNKNSSCYSFKIILPLNGNYEKDVILQVNASLSGQKQKDSTEFNSGLLMLTNETQTYLEKKLSGYQLGIGSNLTMQLLSSFNTTYIIGSTKSEQFDIVVENAVSSKGGAYGACVRASVAPRTVGIARTSPNCALTGEGTVTCVPSEPIFGGNSVRSSITLDTKSLTGDIESIEIKAELFNPCNENVFSLKKIAITLQREFQITIVGESFPSAVLNVTREQNEYEGIRHVYSILNTGVTSWKYVKCNVRVPQFVNYNVSTHSRGEKCELNLSDKVVACVLNKLDGKGERNITIFMDVQSDTNFADKMHKGMAELETELSCIIAGEERSKRITTTINLLHTPVPLWILIVAVAIGLLVFVIAMFILYKYGFLRRKHKEELNALKRNVRRQSIRRSMSIRDSMIEESRKQLLESNKQDETGLIFMNVTEPTDLPYRCSRILP